MATLFTTGFEDYADGNSFAAHGWSGPFGTLEVVTSTAHTGSKSAQCIAGTPTMYRTIAPATQSVSAEAWFRKPVLASLGLQLALFHTTGSSTVQVTNGITIDGGEGVAVFTTGGGNLSQVNNLIAINTYYQLKIHIYMSSVNVTLDGVNSDGCISVWLDGVEIIALTGQEVTVTDTGWASGLNYPPDAFQIGGTSSWFDDLTVTDDVMTCPTAILQIQGSAVFGMNTTVTVTRAIAFGVDGATNVHATTGMVRVFGDLEVSGDLSGGASISAFLDGLGHLMAIPYTQDWAAGNSTFTSMDVYDRPTDGPDALYPDVMHQTATSVIGGALDWSGTFDDYQGAGVWFRGMGSLNGGGVGNYALTGFWDATLGYVECTYLPNATSLGVSNFSPLIQLENPGGTSLLDLSYDFTAPEYLVQYNTESGFASVGFAGETPTAGVPLTVRLEWLCGTETVPDTHDADGYVRVYLNETLAYDSGAVELYLTFLSNPNDLIDGVAFGFVGLIGSLDDITISDVAFVPSLALTGSAVFGMNTTVTATHAIALGVDGATNVHSTTGMVKIFGDLDVTGEMSLSGDLSALLDGLGT